MSVTLSSSMGKINGSSSSWLSVVKRAFKSPSKENSSRTKGECEQEYEDDKVSKMSITSCLSSL